MRKLIISIAEIFLITSLIGCDAVQRKFTRKKKAPSKPRFYQLKKYQRKDLPDLYKQHYAYWQSWQSELIGTLGQNRKKDSRGIEEALGHLKDMQDILVPEKGDEMQPRIDKMENIRKVILRSELMPTTRDNTAMALEREERTIRRYFCYSKVKDSIKKSLDDEAAPLAVNMAAGKEAPVEAEK